MRSTTGGTAAAAETEVAVEKEREELLCVRT